MEDQSLNFMHTVHFCSKIDLNELFSFLKSKSFFFESELGYVDMKDKRIEARETEALTRINKEGGEVHFLSSMDDILMNLCYIPGASMLMITAWCVEIPYDSPPHLRKFVGELAAFFKKEYPLSRFLTRYKEYNYAPLDWCAETKESVIETAKKAAKILGHFSQTGICKVTFVKGDEAKMTSVPLDSIENMRKSWPKNHYLGSIYFSIFARHPIYVCIYPDRRVTSLAVFLDKEGWFEENRKLDIDTANQLIQIIENKLDIKMDLDDEVHRTYPFLMAVGNRLAFKTDEDLQQ